MLKSSRITKLNLIVIMISLLLFILLGFSHSELLGKQLNLYLNEIIPYSWIPFFVFITGFGYEFVNFLLLFSSIFLGVLRRFKELILLLLSTGGGYALIGILKPVFKKERPTIDGLLSTQYNAHGYSYPSGHAVLAVCFWGVFIYLAFRYIENKWLKYSTITGLIILLLLIGLSRVILGVHYLIDVLGGYFIGVFWLGINIYVYNLKNRE